MTRLYRRLLACLALGSASPALAQEASGGVDFDLENGFGAHGEIAIGRGGEPDEAGDDDRPAAYSPAHPFALGARSGVWIQRSLEPGVGGHIRFRPLSWVGVELSTDHFFTVDQPLARRDHVVGADLFLSLVGDDRFFIAPTVGGLLDVRVTEASAPARDDSVQPLAGVHGGLMGEVYVVDGLAVSAAGKAGVFIGAAGEVSLTDDAHIAGEVFVEPFGIATLGGSYYF